MSTDTDSVTTCYQRVVCPSYSFLVWLVARSYGPLLVKRNAIVAVRETAMLNWPLGHGSDGNDMLRAKASRTS